MSKVHFFGMYGMGGHTTDPGEDWFTARVKAMLPDVDIHDSPYRDYDAGHIAALIDQLPEDAVVFVQGTSLGANDAPIVGGYTKRTIHGMFGFQASEYGVHSSLTPNVLFAALFYSYNPIPFPGLGAYCWKRGPGFDYRRLHLIPKHIPHPGDYDKPSQDYYLTLMRRIIAKPNG
jgi:hypothetical protein